MYSCTRTASSSDALGSRFRSRTIFTNIFFSHRCHEVLRDAKRGRPLTSDISTEEDQVWVNKNKCNTPLYCQKMEVQPRPGNNKTMSNLMRPPFLPFLGLLQQR